MFEEYTYENILARMLNNVSDEVDKREGSVIYDALAPAAVELQLIYIELEEMLKQCFADTADRAWLVKRAKERGLEPYQASAAVLRGIFDPSDADVEGKRFNLDSLNYVAGEALEGGGRAVYCEASGSEGNYHFGTMTPLEYIEGLKSAYLTELITPGTDEEDTEDFRERYLKSLNSQAFGGNIADYRQKVMELNQRDEVAAAGGIGQVRVYSADEWNGGGTVKLVIASRADTPPSEGLISSVQEYIDPLSTQGKGVGIAPVGHIVTVAGVGYKDIDIAITATAEEGCDTEALEGLIGEEADKYLKELNSGWEGLYTGSSDDGITVVVSYLAGLIQMLTGIKSIESISVGGAAFGKSLKAERNSFVRLGSLAVQWR